MRRHHAERGLPTIFKLTSCETDAELDRLLATRDHVRDAPTSVQTADLHASNAVLDPSVTVSSDLTPAWFEAFNRISATPSKFQATERDVLERMVPPHGFAALEIAGQTVAAGLAVVERGNVGLFDIVVDPGVRNRGLGRRLCTSLLAWARTWHAAHIAYLAVMQDNAPARSLYARLGFGEVYTY
jgi:GNAT superfamily N-acetyltransferase